ncbi:MAG: GDSL-type esterase/lipase family protein [Treponema sp.]|nr:GDSL-type esterase/lipase family protein [Treponema sp.]
MWRQKTWLKVLVLTNFISLFFLAIVLFHYKVPKKVLVKLGFSVANKVTVSRHIARNELFSEYYQKKYRIVMLGDSITEWVAWNELLGIDDIANRGIAGDTTQGFCERLSTVYSVNPEMCFLMGGINDILRGISVESILTNTESIIEELKMKGIKPIIQSTLYVSKEHSNWKTVNKNVSELNDGLRSVCLKKSLMFLDVNALLSVDGAIKNENVYDGLHLSGLGYKEWGKLLIEIIEND